jgi:hypothetical protein
VGLPDGHSLQGLHHGAQKGLNPHLAAYLGWQEEYASHSQPGPVTAKLLQATKVDTARALLSIAGSILADPQLRGAFKDVCREWPLFICASLCSDSLCQ